MELQIYLNLQKTEPLEFSFKTPPLEFNLIDSSFASKEETLNPSYPNHPNCRSNLECKVKTSAIKDFDPSSSEHHDPSEHETK